MKLIRLKVFCLAALIGVIAACSDSNAPQTSNNEQVKNLRTQQDKLATVFTPVTSSHFKPPTIKPLTLPPGNDGAVIWGASGRDDKGNLYFGTSTYSNYNNTAFLYQRHKVSGDITPQSDVISQLKKAGYYKDGISQNKLHSKFYQADDGYIYFTSFDEKGESASRGILPTHGSHFWRKRPDDKDWEHLLATREALIALNTDGRYVYALGYWNHVLYQYDTLSRRFNRVTVGSIAGHISRNFVVSANGRVFVPKVESIPDGSKLVNLMEYDSDLNLLDAHPLEDYLTDNTYTDHGIVAYTNMKNGDIYFTTGKGGLYKISEGKNRKHEVTLVTLLQEIDGTGGYFPSLFSIDGRDFLVGMGKLDGSKHYSWFIHQVSTDTTVFYDVKELNNNFLLYGSVTRDDEGNLYVVGVDRNDRAKHHPQILQLNYPKETE